MIDGREPGTREIVSFGPFRLLRAERLLLKEGTPVAIGHRALDILIALTDRAGEVVSGRELLNLVWPNMVVEEANLRVQLAALRKVLGDRQGQSRYIINLQGRGYIFVEQIQRLQEKISASTPISAVPTHELRFSSQFLVGRDEDIATVSSLLLKHRFVNVVGPGGIGKTSVARAVLQSLKSSFGDQRVCFVDLGAITAPSEAPGAIAMALSCPVQGPDPEPYIRAFLADKRMLVVIDSCEHVIKAVAPLMERLFHEAPLVHLLATSRETLRVQNEAVYLLTPLALPQEDVTTTLQALASPAVQLFMERAAFSGHNVQLSDPDAPTVAWICRRLDGIPLAIELVASRVGVYGIQGIADLLNTGSELVLHGRRSAVPRHQTLQATLEWSYGLLSPDEQRLLRRLSIFVGEFTLKAALEVVGNGDDRQMVADLIARLVDKSLIWISSTNEAVYYRLLDTTHAYAAARLTESGEADELARRHAGFCANYLELAANGDNHSEKPNIAIDIRHIGNIHKALSWSFSATGDYNLGIRLVALACQWLLKHSLFAECRQWTRRALQLLSDADRGSRIELDLLEGLMLSSIYFGDVSQEIQDALERALKISEDLKDLHHQIHLLGDLRLLHARRGDFSRAMETARKLVDAAKASGDAAENAAAEWILASAYHSVGDQAAALRHSEAGFQLILGKTRSKKGLFGFDHRVRGYSILARTLWLNGFPDRAREAAREALQIAHHDEHIVTKNTAYLRSIPVLIWMGEFDEASNYSDAASRLAENGSLGTFHAGSLALRGEIALARGDPRSGLEMLRDALTTMDAIRYHMIKLEAWGAYAEGLALLGRPLEALAAIDAAIAHAEQTNDVFWLPNLLRARGEILLAYSRADSADAEDALTRSIDVARKQSALGWELKAAIPLSRVLEEQGRRDQALPILEGIYRRFTEGFRTRDLVTARSLLDRLASAS